MKAAWKNIRYPTFIYVLSRIIFLGLLAGLTYWNTHFLGKTFQSQHGWEYLFNQFDSQHFLEIAMNGYSSLEDKMFAFFPLFPLLIKGLHEVLGIPYAYAGVFLNIILTYLSTLILHRIVSPEWKKESVFLFCFSPISYFLFVNYSESLFLFLTLFIWFLYKKEKWLWTGVIIGLAMLTRNAGYLLLFVIVLVEGFEILKNKRSFVPLLKILSFSVPIAFLYPLYTFILRGDFLLFIHSQKDWNKVQGWIIDTWLSDFGKLFNPMVTGHTKFIIVFTFILWVFILYMAIRYIKDEPVLSIFLLLGCLYPLFAKIVDFTPAARSTRSMMRYMLSLFPLYMLIPKLKNPQIRSLIRIVCVITCLLTIVSAFYMKLMD